MLAKKRKGATEKRKGSSGIASLIWMLVGSILTLMIGLFLYLWNPFSDNEVPSTEDRTVTPIGNTDTQAQGDEYEFYDLLPQQEVSSIPDEAVTDDEETELSDTDRALQQVLLEPDVVVDSPEEPAEPLGNDNVVAATGDTEVVIVEEQGTYEDETVTDEGSDTNTATVVVSEPVSATGNDSGAQASTPVEQAVAPRNTYILQINSFSNAEEADARRAQVLMAGVDAQVIKKQMENDQVFYQVVTPPIQNRQAIISQQQRLQNNGIDSLIVEQRR